MTVLESSQLELERSNQELEHWPIVKKCHAVKASRRRETVTIEKALSRLNILQSNILSMVDMFSPY